VEIQEFVVRVLPLHAHVDVGVSGEVIAGAAVTPGELSSYDSDLHVA
jgi:hypothetical protein